MKNQAALSPRFATGIFAGVLLGGFALILPAQAQQAAPAAGGGGVLSLPQGVKRVISIDAFNALMVETSDNGHTERVMMPVKHVYSGGIARLFGGSSIPTDVFVSPGAGGNGAGSTRGNRNGGTGGRGNSPFGVTSVNGGGATGQGFGNTGSGVGSGGIGGLFGGAAGGLGGVRTFASGQLLPPVSGAVTVDRSPAHDLGSWDD